MKLEAKNLNFHSTFKPQMIYIAKLLSLANKNFIGDENEISTITGIPTGQSTGKVLPHLHYAKYMGIIDFEKENGKINIRTTKLGQIIGQEDPYLLEDITRLLLHYNITDIENGAPHWSYLFKVFNYDLEEEYSFKNIEKSFQEYFGKINLKMGVVKGSYQDESFELIRLIEVDGDSIKFNLSYSRIDFINIYTYTLIKSIEQYYNDINEITIDQIINELKWNKPFGFDYDTTLLLLDEIEDRGYITINKQLSPITVIKLIDSDDIISKIYEF